MVDESEVDDATCAVNTVVVVVVWWFCEFEYRDAEAEDCEADDRDAADSCSKDGNEDADAEFRISCPTAPAASCRKVRRTSSSSPP